MKEPGNGEWQSNE